jgi:hypothetical protein
MDYMEKGSGGPEDRHKNGQTVMRHDSALANDRKSKRRHRLLTRWLVAITRFRSSQRPEKQTAPSFINTLACGHYTIPLWPATGKGNDASSQHKL